MSAIGTGRTQARHKRVVCSCGAVIVQCRCIGPHETETWERACEKCKVSPAPTLRVRIDEAVVAKHAPRSSR